MQVYVYGAWPSPAMMQIFCYYFPSCLMIPCAVAFPNRRCMEVEYNILNSKSFRYVCHCGCKFVNTAAWPLFKNFHILAVVVQQSISETGWSFYSVFTIFTPVGLRPSIGENCSVVLLLLLMAVLKVWLLFLWWQLCCDWIAYSCVELEEFWWWQ